MEKEFDNYYISDLIRRTKTGCDWFIAIALISSIVSYYIWDFSYWWTIPIICILYLMIYEIISIKACLLSIGSLVEDIKNNESKE